jgi:hypothetical protein
MDTLLDYNDNNIINNLESFLNFMLVDYNTNISTKYTEFESSINALLQKKEFALTHYNKFIKNCTKPFLSYEHLMYIINDVHNNSFNNKTYNFAMQVWLYIYH